MCERCSLPFGREVQVKLLKSIVVGSVLISAGQVLPQRAFAEDDTSTEIRLLKAKLKQLEQRVEDQGRKEKQYEAQAKASAKAPVAYKAASVFDPCPVGKFCYKGITLTPGGFIDLTDIYRTRNLASDVGSIYNSIPFRGNKNYNIGENRFSARTSRF